MRRGCPKSHENKSWKTNPSGGFWHKNRYPNQMWLDLLYMAGTIAVMYGKEFWGRAIGWFPVALLEMFECFPEDHKDKPKLVSILQDLFIALPNFQDAETGLWYQVVNKGDQPDNWLENSCTSLYVHAIAKAVRFGYLDAKYLEYAWKGYQGVIDTLNFDENGHAVIGNICIGTGIGDYAHYIARPTSENDQHGTGAFILMCVEMSKAQRLE